MGHCNTAEGQITITPPIAYRDIEDSLYLPEAEVAYTAEGDWRECQYVLDGAERVVVAVAVEALDGDKNRKRYKLAEHVQDLIDRHPNHVFAGHLERLGEDGDRWRLVVRDRLVMRVDPVIMRPEPAPAAGCCDGTGLADFAAVPCPNPDCPVPPAGA